MLKDSGTLTSDGTEQVVTTQTDDRFYQFLISRLNQHDGESLIIRVYTKMLIGDSYEVLISDTFNDAPSTDDVQQISIPIPSDIGMKVTVQATTGRDYKWKLMAYGSA